MIMMSAMQHAQQKESNHEKMEVMRLFNQRLHQSFSPDQAVVFLDFRERLIAEGVGKFIDEKITAVVEKKAAAEPEPEPDGGWTGVFGGVAAAVGGIASALPAVGAAAVGGLASVFLEDEDEAAPRTTALTCDGASLEFEMAAFGEQHCTLSNLEAVWAEPPECHGAFRAVCNMLQCCLSLWLKFSLDRATQKQCGASWQHSASFAWKMRLCRQSSRGDVFWGQGYDLCQHRR